ncbi:hypothetical protein AAT19DRAFT_10815 [Rhodotorula toruloides]|uniref:Uncharacterized protein n=1 Tax=Rhodotorula toruloides TaxID=5286 RepID=A0A2S9ZY13_RHOTO|nr:hypothetical protein AAT19DRAFT_10815 [Rhodotorula toruloides]
MSALSSWSTCSMGQHQDNFKGAGSRRCRLAFPLFPRSLLLLPLPPFPPMPLQRAPSSPPSRTRPTRSNPAVPLCSHSDPVPSDLSLLDKGRRPKRISGRACTADSSVRPHEAGASYVSSPSRCRRSRGDFKQMRLGAAGLRSGSQGDLLGLLLLCSTSCWTRSQAHAQGSRGRRPG